MICFIIIHSTVIAQTSKPDTLFAHFTQEIIHLDGHLTESAWEDAMHISNFTQRELKIGEPATESTEVAILYDDENLYIGFWGYDREPEKIIANQMRRDFDWVKDDNFELIIDTYNDNRNGYLFVTNPNGARADALVLNNGDQFNKDWDGVWYAKTSRTEEGWFAELKIPLATLKFNSLPDQIWGINFERNIRRKREQLLWQGWSRDADLEQVNRAGHLSGLLNVKSRNLIDLRPYLLGGIETGEPGSGNSWLGNAGLNASYLITPALKADFTILPDFAQTEVDRVQINLTRFSLFYPEKRSFFLEGKDFFEFDMGGQIRPFYSRQIGISEQREAVPIYGGARIYGKLDRSTIGAMSLQTGASDEKGPANFSIARFQQDIFSQSTVGLFTATKMQKDRLNTVNGADILLASSRFLGNKNVAAGAALVNSHTSDRNQTSGWTHRFFVSYPNDRLEIDASWERVTGSFNAETGFLERENYQMLFTEIQFNPRPSSIPWMQQAQIKPVDINYYFNDSTGELQTLQMEFRPLGFGTKSGEFIEFNIFRYAENITRPFEIGQDVTVPDDTYWFTRYEVKGYTFEGRPLSIEYGTVWGDFMGGKRNEFGGEITWQTSKYLNLEADYQYNDIRLPWGNLQVHEIGGRANFAFSPDLFGSLFGQWNSTMEQVIFNFRFNWIPVPGSDVFFVINQVIDTSYRDWRINQTNVLTKFIWRFPL